MRILRTRIGFQADHSSSNYLFYAVDRSVSRQGQQVAHRYSSRADVDDHSVHYQKWGGNLHPEAFKALLAGHFDVMASESYDWWTLVMAVPKTPEMKSLLAPFKDGLDEGGTDVEDYGPRLGVVVSCAFDYEGPVFAEYDDDSLETLTELLAKIRTEIMQGDVSFLQAVALFYGSDEEDEEAEEPAEPLAIPQGSSKAELQQACMARGIDFRKSWTKDQLRSALRKPRKAPGRSRPARLSRAASKIVKSLTHL